MVDARSFNGMLADTFLFMVSNVLRRPLPILNAPPSRIFSTTFPFRHGCCGKNRSVHSFLNNSCYNNFSSVLARCSEVRDLRALKSLLIVQGLITQEFFVGEFTKKCFELGETHLAVSTSEIAIKRQNHFQQNLLLKHLCDRGLFEDALLIYGKCRFLGCLSDNYTFPFVIKACIALGDFLTGTATHCLVLKCGFCENLVVQTALVGFYSAFRKLETARFVLDRISEPDVVAWNALISGCSFNGFDVEVLQLFREMCARGLKPNVSTLASIIPVCSRFETSDVGKSLHGFAVKFGIDMEESLLPALISMYANWGDMFIARSLFDCSKHKNIVIWNSMISAYTKNQKSDSAFELFCKLLQLGGMQPNIVTFVSILPSCENSGSFYHCQSLHAYVVKFGLENQQSVATALLSVYAKHGNINSAEFLFNCMLQRNLMSWNSMVSAYVGNGLPCACLDTFRQMQFAGFNPDAISIVSVLSACSKLDAFLLGKSAHAFSLKNGIDLKLNVSNALLEFYSNCSILSLSFNIFQRMMTRNVVSWNTMISGCIYNGQAENALLLFHQMQQDDVDFDLVTLISLLPACSEIKDLMLGVAIHGYAIKTGLIFDVSLVNALLSMYANCGDIESSVLLFENMPTRNVISWNALITGYRNHNLQDGALALLVHQMMQENHRPNYITLLNVLPLCNTHFEGKAIHAYAVRTGILCETPFLTSSLVLMYARFGNSRSCKLLFQQEEAGCNLSLWNAIISAQVRLKDAETAFTLFIELLQRKIRPDSITFLSVISACSQLNNLALADSVFAYLIHKGFDKDIAINNALIDLYVRCGNLSFSKKLFDLFPHKDPISWSTMIEGYGSYGEGEAALNLFYQMRHLGIKPDEITYLSVLSACSHAGLVEECRTLFNCMVHDGSLLPKMEHYACIVDLLGRTGHLREAYVTVKSLPCHYHYNYKSCCANMLESLLGACLTHGNIEVGEEIGKLLIEMEPGKSSAYVILHNIYAAAGRWMDANRVRSVMERNKVRKVPGFSLIEGRGRGKDLITQLGGPALATS